MLVSEEVDDLGIPIIPVAIFTAFVVNEMQYAYYANQGLKIPKEDSETYRQIVRFRQELQRNWNVDILKYPKVETVDLCKHATAMAQHIYAEGSKIRDQLVLMTFPYKSGWVETHLPFERKLLRWIPVFQNAAAIAAKAIPIDAYKQTLFIDGKQLPGLRDQLLEFCLDAGAYVWNLEYITLNNADYQLAQWQKSIWGVIASVFTSLGDLVRELFNVLVEALKFLAGLVRALPSTIPWLLIGALTVGGGFLALFLVKKAKQGKKLLTSS